MCRCFRTTGSSFPAPSPTPTHRSPTWNMFWLASTMRPGAPGLFGGKRRDAAGRVGFIGRDAADDGLTYGTLELSGQPPVVCALHERILDRVAPGDSLRFTHSVHDAERAVRSGDALAAYVLPPTTPEDVLAATGRGERLPRKSTFFWPKPRTGLVLMPVR